MTNILPEHLSEELLIPLMFSDENLWDPAPAELTKVEVGVRVISSSHTVVCATPWPNSTGPLSFKLILAARVEPSATVPTSKPIPRNIFRLFFSPFGIEPDGSKLSSDIATRLERIHRLDSPEN